MIDDPKTSPMNDRQVATPPSPLREGVDYYMENGLCVFTKEYHLRRGYCCRSGCRHCAYGFVLSSAEDLRDAANKLEG
jgi:hypothetical protein